MAYVGICSNNGIVVAEDDAFDYAMDEVKNDEELRQEFVDWFYSGNWYKENEN